MAVYFPDKLIEFQRKGPVLGVQGTFISPGFPDIAELTSPSSLSPSRAVAVAVPPLSLTTLNRGAGPCGRRQGSAGRGPAGRVPFLVWSFPRLQYCSPIFVLHPVGLDTARITGMSESGKVCSPTMIVK